MRKPRLAYSLKTLLVVMCMVAAFLAGHRMGLREGQQPRMDEAANIKVQHATLQLAQANYELQRAIRANERIGGCFPPSAFERLERQIEQAKLELKLAKLRLPAHATEE